MERQEGGMQVLLQRVRAAGVAARVLIAPQLQPSLGRCPHRVPLRSTLHTAGVDARSTKRVDVLRKVGSAHAMFRLEEGAPSRQPRLGQPERMTQSFDVASTAPRQSTQAVLGRRNGLLAGGCRGWAVAPTQAPAVGVTVRPADTFCGAVHLSLRP